LAIRNSVSAAAAADTGRWHDRLFVKGWDKLAQNPLKADQLDLIATVIKDNWRARARVLDLGCGTGKFEAVLLARLPRARFVCVDRSEVMLERARERLGPACRFVSRDLARLDGLALAESPFRFIVTVDVLHELTDSAKLRLLRFCRANLARDGLLLVLDRLAVDAARLGPAYRSVLGRLQRATGVKSGQFSGCFTDPRHHDHEHPWTLDRYIASFKRAGFVAGCLHLHFHKAVFAARRAG
jgi:SAM-dependent methyltransferase